MVLQGFLRKEKFSFLFDVLMNVSERYMNIENGTRPFHYSLGLHLLHLQSLEK
jgi:hypothetical protein